MLPRSLLPGALLLRLRVSGGGLQEPRRLLAPALVDSPALQLAAWVIGQVLHAVLPGPGPLALLAPELAVLRLGAVFPAEAFQRSL